jgi:tRNA(fMet)-specific endonuclease VapC
VKYLFDTDHVSILQRRSAPEHAILVARAARYPPSDRGFSLVSFHEQVLGAHTFISRSRTAPDTIRGYEYLAEILHTFSSAPVVPFDAAAVSRYDDLRRQRVRLATMDLRIAATALSRGLIVLTRNVRDFGKVPGLVTEDWTV